MLRRVRGEPIAARAALVGVPHHRHRIVGADDDEIKPTETFGDWGKFDVAGLAHGTGIERRDLVLVEICCAEKARSVPLLGNMYGGRIDAVPVEPGAVVGEVGADRADQHRTLMQLRQPETDVRRDTAAADLEFVDEKRQ